MDGEIRDALEKPSVSALSLAGPTSLHGGVALPKSRFGNFCFFGAVIKFELTIHEKEIYHLGFSIYSERGGWGCGGVEGGGRLGMDVFQESLALWAPLADAVIRRDRITAGCLATGETRRCK